MWSLENPGKLAADHKLHTVMISNRDKGEDTDKYHVKDESSFARRPNQPCPASWCACISSKLPLSGDSWGTRKSWQMKPTIVWPEHCVYNSWSPGLCLQPSVFLFSPVCLHLLPGGSYSHPWFQLPPNTRDLPATGYYSYYSVCE